MGVDATAPLAPAGEPGRNSADPEPISQAAGGAPTLPSEAQHPSFLDPPAGTRDSPREAAAPIYNKDTQAAYAPWGRAMAGEAVPSSEPTEMLADDELDPPSTEAPPDLHRLLASSVLRLNLLKCAREGLPATQAAARVGCNVETARYIYREPSFREEALGAVNRAFADLDAAFLAEKRSWGEELEQRAWKSFDAINELLEGDDLAPSVKLRAHEKFLDRIAASAPVHNVRHVPFDATQLRLAASAAEEMDNVVPIAVGKGRRKTG